MRTPQPNSPAEAPECFRLPGHRIPGLHGPRHRLPERPIVSRSTHTLQKLKLSARRYSDRESTGAHQVTSESNTQLAPLIQRATAVDLEWDSQVLLVFRDTLGHKMIATHW